jgi:hypothetical protein
MAFHFKPRLELHPNFPKMLKERESKRKRRKMTLLRPMMVLFD